MIINATEHGEVTVFTLNGSLDATTAEQVIDSIGAEFRNQRVNVVIDLSGVDFMSSAGLRAILAGTQDARNVGGDLRLAGANKNVKRVLDFSGFTKIMKYFDTVTEAVDSFAA